MHENFIALNSEKRDRIINAAIHEFTVKDYRDASTNEIVKKAGISKGALFHYFISKKDLFEFLYRYCLKFYRDAIWGHIDQLSTDVFERWIELTIFKFTVNVQYPKLIDFLHKASQDDSEDIQDIFKEEVSQLAEDFNVAINDGIDSSKFKPEVNIPKALQLIWWVLEGFGNSKYKELISLSKKLNDAEFIENATQELKEYLKELEKVFYKEEFIYEPNNQS